MYNDESLIDHLKTKSTIQTQSFVYAEINLNDSSNIQIIGNYRNRPASETIVDAFSTSDTSAYEGYTDSDVVIDGGITTDSLPQAFISTQDKTKLLFSLEECFGKFRPRSGINKAVFFPGHYSHVTAPSMMNRPRYYIADKDDKFKYWSSFRLEKADFDSTYKKITAATVNVETDTVTETDPDDPDYGETFTFVTNNSVTYTCQNHGLSIGESVFISGVTPKAFTGANVVISVTQNTFTVNAPQNVGSVESIAYAYVYSKQTSVERGISKVKKSTGQYYIDDAAPFVVYKEKIPANRIIFKMQTHAGSVPVTNSDGTNDPVYDNGTTILNRAVPAKWKVQVLDRLDKWVDIFSVDPSSSSEQFKIPVDGYVELQYLDGEWIIGTEALEASTPLITDLTSPQLIDPDDVERYEQFQIIRGIRFVADTMTKQDKTFDLIEMSPRLAVDLSDVTQEFSISKTASDLGTSGMPVGQLLASDGSISFISYDDEFNRNNAFINAASSGNIANKYGTINPNGSVIAKYIKRGAQFKFYEVVRNLDTGGSTFQDAYVPLKALYADSFPEFSASNRDAKISLRDAYYYFEDTLAPQVVIGDVSLSFAIATVLDSIGFTNYVYKKSPNDSEPIIPFFYIAPKTTIAEVLQDLAVSTQTAIFFDEYNNLVFMSKRYMMPDPGTGDRETDVDEILIGTVSNDSPYADQQPNIMEISSEDSKIFNDGVVKFSERYIQKTVSQVSPAADTSSNGAARERLVLPSEQKWVYSPVLLWEPSPSESARPTNSESNNSQSGETLAAIPLKADLRSDIPVVVDRKVKNNIISLGEAVYWLPRYNGYFYANGEIIRYDAVEYSVAGVADAVWISSPREYSEYFGKLRYNGKIYPTGNVRIFVEPRYETINGEVVLANGAVLRHGRGQFGTEVTGHFAGITPNHWTQKNVTGLEMDSDLLFADKSITKKKIKNVSASGKTFTVSAKDKKYLIVGQKVKGTDVSTEITDIMTESSKKFKTKKSYNFTGKTLTLSGKNIYNSYLVKSYFAESGTRYSNTIAKQSSRNSLIKNYMSSAYKSENSNNSVLSAATLQSSALVFAGPSFTSDKPRGIDNLSIVYKDLSTEPGVNNSMCKHFGTRMRIIGTDANDPLLASSAGSTTMFDTQEKKIKGSSGGLSIMYDPVKNTGYFFELIALTDESLEAYKADSEDDLSESMFNLAFYKTYKKQALVAISDITVSGKTVKYHVSNHSFKVGDMIDVSDTQLDGKNLEVTKVTDTLVHVTYPGNIPGSLTNKTGSMSYGSASKSAPVKIWTGMANVITDNGMFTGQQRLTGQENPSVYDIAVEYEDLGLTVGGTGYKFYFYLNNLLVGTAIDEDPIPRNSATSIMGLFVRGSSRVMFENMYALGTNEKANYRNASYAPYRDALSLNKKFDSDAVFSTKYSLPKAVQASYFSGISPIAPRATNLFYEEFGTIMREVKYYNVTYDKAYPALRSMIAPTFNPIKGYAIGGYVANPYSAEFLVFNTMDSALVLGDNQNPLNIIGITFTQQSDYNYSMDEHLSKASDFSSYEQLMPGSESQSPFNPAVAKQTYSDVKNSRVTYGKKDFTIDGVYIQSRDSAEALMDWMVKKTALPRKSVGLSVFGMPHIQLGDIVQIKHTNNGVNFVNPDSLFVVYNIEYSASGSGPSTQIYVSEVNTNG